MALRKIVRDYEERLYRKSRPVEKFNLRLRILLDDMADTMRENAGVGLSAVQVGVLRRCFVTDTGEGLHEFVNPEILSAEGSAVDLEGCLSSPGEFGYVERPEKVTVRAQDRDGRWFTLEAEGLLARCLCHENDHLDGHTFKELTDHILTEEELRSLEEGSGTR